MTFKELIRSAITGEMSDITSCEVDAEAFPAAKDAAALFTRMAAEKRERLLELGKIFREGTGFRQRRNEVSKSLESALRARAARAAEASSVYAALSKQMNKPEYKEALKAFASRELELLSEIRGLQSPK